MVYKLPTIWQPIDYINLEYQVLPAYGEDNMSKYYHYEYKEVFNQFYESLKEENVDCIVLCGDIAHTKTQISPEFVKMSSDLFRNLADIAPTYIILGNHDGNLKNSSRQDALTPIVDALEHNSLYLLKDSGEVLLDEQFTILSLIHI